MKSLILPGLVVLTAVAAAGCCCPQETPEQKAAREERQAERDEKAAEKARKAEARIRKKEKGSKFQTDVIVSVEVKSRKRNGKHWDIAKGKPDPQVTLRNERTGRVLKSEVVRDQRNAQFRFSKLAANKGDKLKLSVIDADAAVGDKIGSYHAFFEPDDWQSGTLDRGYIEVQFRDAR